MIAAHLRQGPLLGAPKHAEYFRKDVQDRREVPLAYCLQYGVHPQKVPIKEKTPLEARVGRTCRKCAWTGAVRAHHAHWPTR
jgi:hypothetical protein